MPGRNFLFVPGPSNVPDRIQRAMLVAMEDHRSARFPELSLPCFTGLQRLFRTENGTPMIFPSSGTGCWEAALTNCLNPGDRVLAARFGQFSQLWIDMCERLGFEVAVLEEEWGTGASAERYHAALAADREHRIKAVLLCQNETSTGVTSDVAAVRAAIDTARHPALLFVDSVSALGCIEFRMMLPAGLGITCVSVRALDAAKAARSRRSYFDYGDMAPAARTGYFPYTPSVPLLHGLRESLTMLFEEGLENVFARHHYLAGGVRAAVQQGWRLELCARDAKWYSDAVSAVMLPAGIDGAKVVARAGRRYNLALGAGLSKVAGKLFRIGHLGDLNELMLLGAIAGAEMAMLDLGVKVEPGSGVAAAGRYWREHAAPAGLAG
jgi:alanine-glyoxylate transaminase / serine-glyoxylate transaminase / serine-pyruvate transaminase